jgi:hypothetical protein
MQCKFKSEFIRFYFPCSNCISISVLHRHYIRVIIRSVKKPVTGILIIIMCFMALSYAVSAGSPKPANDRDSLIELIKDKPSTGIFQPGSEVPDKKSENLKRSVMQRIGDWLYKMWLKILEWLFKHAPRTSAPGHIDAPARILNWLVVAIIAVLLLFFLYNIIPFFKSRVRRMALEDKEDEQDTISISMMKALEKGDLLANANDFMGALQEILKGFFMGLDEINKIPYQRSRTNREYERLIRRKAPSFNTLAQEFLPYMEGVLYAGSSAEASRYYYFRDFMKKNFYRQNNP